MCGQSHRGPCRYRSTRIFSEWIGIYKAPGATDRTFHSFLQDLHNRQVMNNVEEGLVKAAVGVLRLMLKHGDGNVDAETEE
jgi:CCR4-NOT transcription complex subunit 1